MTSTEAVTPQAPVSRWIRRAAVLAVTIVAALIATFIFTTDQPLVGIGGDDGKLGGDFTLQGVDGPVSLADYRGKVVVLYFGFLNCEEVCLNSMRVLQNTMLRMQAEELEQVRAMLISIDPARDSQQDLASFTANYHANIIGLTGSEAQIEYVSRDYGAHFEISDTDRDDPGYFFRHSSRYYIINQQGELIDAMRHSTTPNEIIARVRQLLAPATSPAPTSNES